MDAIRGKLITFEGTEGVGKSTQIERLKECLESHGKTVLVTREPGGTELGEKIRELLLNNNMHEMTELLLMFAARAEHIEHKIKPALHSGAWVLCDRFTESSYAYQGFGRMLDLNILATLETIVQADFKPDLTFWLNAPVILGLNRAEKRSELDRFEQESFDFFERILEGYRWLSAERHQQIIEIDATKSIEEVHTSIFKFIHELIN